MRYICFRSLDGSIFWKRGVYSSDSQGIGVSPVDYLSATCRVGRKSCGCYRANAADWDTSRQDVFPEKEWRYTRFPRDWCVTGRLCLRNVPGRQKKLL